MGADGSTCILRHAPRKRKRTGEPLPAPTTPAVRPSHWKNPAPGEKPPPPPEDLVPDFYKWRKLYMSRPAPMSAQMGGATPMQGDMTPFLGARTPLHGGGGAQTPKVGELFAGAATPAMRTPPMR